MNAVTKLSITDLTKNYGNTRGIVDLSLDIHKGEIFGYLGPNGAGKTTTIRCIMNILIPDSGAIMIDQDAVSRSRSDMHNNIGYLPGELYFPKGYTGQQMINYIDSLRRVPSDRAEELITKFKFDPTKNIQALSHGNKQKLGIILAFMHNPDLIVLDEPTSGLDPLFQQELYDLILEEKAKGKTIFFSSHNLDEVQKICDRVAIIREGELINVENVENLSETIPRKLTAIASDIDLTKLDAQNLQYSVEGNQIDFVISDKHELATVLELLISMEVEDITYPPTSLEEYFMTYYNQET